MTDKRNPWRPEYTQVRQIGCTQQPHFVGQISSPRLCRAASLLNTQEQRQPEQHRRPPPSDSSNVHRRPPPSYFSAVQFVLSENNQRLPDLSSYVCGVPHTQNCLPTFEFTAGGLLNINWIAVTPPSPSQVSHLEQQFQISHRLSDKRARRLENELHMTYSDIWTWFWYRQWLQGCSTRQLDLHRFSSNLAGGLGISTVMPPQEFRPPTSYTTHNTMAQPPTSTRQCEEHVQDTTATFSAVGQSTDVLQTHRYTVEVDTPSQDNLTSNARQPISVRVIPSVRASKQEPSAKRHSSCEDNDYERGKLSKDNVTINSVPETAYSYNIGIQISTDDIQMHKV
ncbi:uncharacterized protein LOC134197859 [Corticium candelabrum]|uniref:uncharacterized protein LOC134197859 n=1 Tax=Corticium candelabrum TaxID=121492 RepID=UPI002E256C82|nr:uncharacterized protein LOC134197859 [Corticium candelabrum]